MRAETGQHPPSQQNVEKEEMFRVHVGWDMDYHTRMRVKKAVEILNETKKKPDEDWFASKRASLMNNLDTFGGNDLDMEGMGTSLHGGCVGLDASIGDVRKMGMPEVKKRKKKEEKMRKKRQKEAQMVTQRRKRQRKTRQSHQQSF